MNQLLDSFRGWADSQVLAGRSIKARVAFLAAAGVVFVVAGVVFHPVELVMVLTGSLGGLAWFLAGYLAWWSLLGDAWHARLDLRARWDVGFRRRVAFVVGGVWAAVMLVLGTFFDLGNALFGAGAVVVASVFWLMVTMTPAERQAAFEAWEAAQQADVWAEGEAPAEPAPAPRRGLLRRFLGR